MVTLNKVNSALSLVYKEGVDATGKDIIKNQKFSKVKVTSTDEQLFAVATALSNVMEYQVIRVLRDDSNIIVNE